MERPSFEFVCMGNTFRSFWAEQAFASLVGTHADLSSSGLQPNLRNIVDSLALATLSKHDYSYIPRQRGRDFFHMATSLTKERLTEGKIVIPMENWMVEEILKLDPPSTVRIETLGSLAGEPETEVPDPLTILKLSNTGMEFTPTSGLSRVFGWLRGRQTSSSGELDLSRKEFLKMQTKDVAVLSPTFQEIERLSVLAITRLIKDGVLPAEAVNRYSPGYKKYTSLFEK